jgi:putative ABC transport system permease protein
MKTNARASTNPTAQTSQPALPTNSTPILPGLRMYFKYSTRSLIRGGQRTILAIFCIAIGVMAIVALQLVGLMINNAFISNVRDANGGDIAVTSQNATFKQSDLAFFDQLKRNGTIINYTPVLNITGSTGLSSLLRETFSIKVVDPNIFPIVTPPVFTTPANGTVAALLRNNHVIVTQSFINQSNKKLGDTLIIHTGGGIGQGGRTMHVKIAAIVADTGVFAFSGSTMLLSINDYAQASPNIPVLYDTIDITTSDQAHTDRTVKAINQQFPLANIQTTSDALRLDQTAVDNVRKFLEIAGLLALLIGGVGIINTMQVLLSRRKIEIAMLKTTGYRRIDLYLLFGLEAGLLGLIGGLVGTALATVVSYLVRNLVQQLFPLRIPFQLDPLTIAGGALIGLATALIFGLLPIVQAANIRPLNVIRELPGGTRLSSISLTIALLLILSLLFCILSIIILNNDILLGIEVVYSTFIFLAFLSIFFGMAVLVLSKLPVPERFNPAYLAFVTAAVILSILLLRFSPVFGGLLLLASFMGYVTVLLPRTWKAITKLALRNLGRQRARTTTTMLALFVGVFTIGLILALGQDLRDQVNATIAIRLSYNVITIAPSDEASTLVSKLTTIPGLIKQRHTTIAASIPQSINGQSLQILLPTNQRNQRARSSLVSDLSTIEGYDVANNQFPDLQNIQITEGRNLNTSDAGTNDVLLPVQLAHSSLIHLKLGDTITLASIDGRASKTVTVVGFYRLKMFATTFGRILATTDTVQALSPVGLAQTIFYMKIDPQKVNLAVETIGAIAPNALVRNLANLGDIINQIISDILLILTTIASMSLLAGIIIIANAVALAMLERRREQGILKSVGYTSSSILSEVLIENALIGGTGALLAMLLATFVLTLLDHFVFNNANFGVPWPIALGLILGITALAMIIAALVAWTAVRIRPLEVLRYE